MSGKQTLRELFVHDDWANDKVFAVAAELDDERLDRPFDIGPGTLRETLRHIYGAERVWFHRWRGSESADLPASSSVREVEELWSYQKNLAESRNRDFERWDEADFGRKVSFESSQGHPYTFPLGDILMHVANHGVHHRAQALNMFRHLNGSKIRGIDYLYMRLEHPTLELDPSMLETWRNKGFDIPNEAESPCALDPETVAEYCHYSDWATAQILQRARGLGDEQLDREFEMGLGTLRKTLLHVHDAESWWCSNWKDGLTKYVEADASTSMDRLEVMIRETIAARDAFIQSCDAQRLLDPVTIEADTGAMLTFRIGESMMQLPPHGTHHRAQAVNMLRRFGVSMPDIDYLDWVEQGSPS